MECRLDTAPATPPSSRCAKRIKPSPECHSSLNAISSAVEAWLDGVATMPDDINNVRNQLPTFSMAPPSLPSSLPPSLPPSSTTQTDASSSPNKTKPSPTIYRNQILKSARIYIGVHEPPAYVQRVIERITTAGLATEPYKAYISPIANALYEESKQLDRALAGEAEWVDAARAMLKALVHQGSREAASKIVSGQDWLPELKPEPLTVSIPMLVSNKRARGTKTTKSLPSTTSFKIKTPRPDIYVSLSDSAFDESTQQLLVGLQNTANLLSDCSSGLCSRFPFLVVETKAPSTGGNLYHAQNQAAVSGSCAVGILRDLGDLINTVGPSTTNDAVDKEMQEPGAETPASHSTLPSLAIPDLVSFSATTEGSIYELWVHWSSPSSVSPPSSVSYDMAKFAVYDSGLNPQSAETLVRHFDAIVDWGLGDLRSWCTKSLHTVTNRINDS